MTHANYNRRFRSKPKGHSRVPTRKLVSFQVGPEQYAIPLERVQCVLKEFTPYGSLQSGYSLVRHQDEVITLVDLSKLFLSSHPPEDRNYLIVCTLTEKERIGIPITEMPKILEIPEDKVDDIPPLYRQSQLSDAVEKLIHAPDGQEVFYINLNHLTFF